MRGFGNFDADMSCVSYEAFRSSLCPPPEPLSSVLWSAQDSDPLLHSQSDWTLVVSDVMRLSSLMDVFDITVVVYNTGVIWSLVHTDSIGAALK